MPSVTSLVGFVDFSASRPLHWVADRLSAELFAGIRFVGRHEGTWDEVEAVHLERDFVGLRVELGGNEDVGYTLEIGTALRAILESPESPEKPCVCDLSEFLSQQVASIPEFALKKSR